MNRLTEALWDEIVFFNLPVAELFEEGMTPLESRHQPTGFIDSAGAWVAILTDDGLKRKLI